MQDFVHLHVHTYYSILDGQSSVQKLVDKAVADGMKGMAITDHGNMFGIKEFYNYCKKVNGKLKAEGKEPFKPIFGCEMYVARRTKDDKEKEKGDMGGYHLIVLAKNYNGYKNLIKLVSRAWVDGYYMRPRTDRADLEKYHEDLIVCSACIAGEVPAKILKGDMEGAREAIEWYHRVFGDDYYLELQRHRVTNPHQRANRETYPLQVRANKALMELAEEYGIKTVCTNDAHFVDEENAEAHDHLLCLSTGKDLDDPNRMLYSKQEWFKTREEMNAVFSDVPEALSNTLEILDKVETYSIDHAPIMPFFPIPEEFGTEEDVRRKYSEKQLYDEFTTDENGENPLPPEEGEQKIKRLGGYEKLYRIKFEADYLAKLAYDGAKRLYGDPLPEEVAERVKFELHIMKTMGFPGYFLIVQDFINSARDELGVMVGPGRGSAAGSVVAYCLGITKIDPIKYDLLFERFLNPDRISLPDIDTDFDDDGRGKVLEWVEDKYGHDKVAHIITYGTMATKNSIKDVARVEKLPLDVSNHLCKAIPDRLPDGLKMNLPNAIKCVPELREAEASPDPQLSNTIKYAKMLEGTVRGTGIHACGTIICRDAISDWVPVSTAEDKSDPGHKLLATQYDGHVIEETGLIKMDFLGLSTLSILKEAVENIRFTQGIEVDLDNIPIDDELTYKLYQEGRTVGTFQFESAGMQKYLRELKPTVFEDLIAMNALYRPGPMDYIPSFIARKNGKEEIKYDIPCMEKYLKDTYGITVYQEQVMLLSRQLANFTRGESDALRKAMGKKKKDIVDAMKPKFIEGGKKNGHDPKVLEKIWADWEKFASYAFNKSHATCYSWVAYQTAYLKAHYPAEFMAGNMSRCLNDITKITKLMNECQAMGIACMGPDVNESRQKFSANKKGEVRFGLGAIKGMGDAAAQAIIDEREKNGQYKDIFDFVQRVNLSAVNSKALESLVLSGAFDGFKIKRESFFARNPDGRTFLETLMRYGQVYQQEKNESRQSLFGAMEEVEIATPAIPQAESWSAIEKLNRERDLVGIYLSAHPLDEFEFILKNLCNTQCQELNDRIELSKKQEVVLGGIVTAVRSKYTKTGKPCGFVTIEDFDGSGELALFGEEWGKWRGMLIEGCTVMVKAQFVQRFRNSDMMEMRITDIQYLQTVKDTQIEKITISLEADKLDDTTVSDLVTIIKDAPGTTQLFFQVRETSNSKPFVLRSRKEKIDISKELISFIKGCEALDYKIN
ncbi:MULTISPECIES: DNA polymerase III subunit alpha [Prevotellaceae]|jgi:DNA polymerase-3 subunit alpha|uniref:DNA polymerase III subunit alpha n=1 Tax=Xylanibacter rarus TaxID=1676614 RepID=A0A8E1R1S2_9BACT|nr:MULTISPECIES: DNA polymerase III subunit alpha [Prevotellaceae]KOO69716.1 DNA polymerase III subunit alpha [Xylanibacter rarus]MBS5876373.1 DNA polymerase III subunit alpha [Prevotella sp.]CCX67902.1 dNA polymerase III alpha subunit [Prevotella sp. CAG:255]HJH76505.1 DNA polymerase III subunit alpha [Prevotellaceae bacterium]